MSHPDCEYVNGVIEERAMGEPDHAAWQKALVIWLIEPKKPAYFRYQAGQLLRASSFALPGSDFQVPLGEIAALVD